VFLTIFNDDTRVNAGKKWSKTETHLVKLSGVPFSESTKDILFVTSAKTSSVDSGQAMTDGLAKLRVGVEGFDPIKRKKIILKGSVLINIGDGPAQSANCGSTVALKIFSIHSSFESGIGSLLITASSSIRLSLLGGFEYYINFSIYGCVYVSEGLCICDTDSMCNNPGIILLWSNSSRLRYYSNDRYAGRGGARGYICAGA
jgi:hypothetical protein